MIELIVVLEMQHDFALAAGAGFDFNLAAQGMAEFLLQGRNLVALGSLLAAGAG